MGPSWTHMPKKTYRRLIMKTKLIHIIYIAVIAGIVLLQSSMNVLEDELRMEIACKDFIIDILKEKE